MKKMISGVPAVFLAAAVMAFGFAGEAGAQQTKQDTKKSETRSKSEFTFYDMLKEKLVLSDEQVKKIFDINQKYKAKRFDVRGDKEKTQQLLDAERQEIDTVLTADQKKRFDEFHSSMKDNHNKDGKSGKETKDGKQPPKKDR